jgi:hypothetical protein
MLRSMLAEHEKFRGIADMQNSPETGRAGSSRQQMQSQSIEQAQAAAVPMYPCAFCRSPTCPKSIRECAESRYPQSMGKLAARKALKDLIRRKEGERTAGDGSEALRREITLLFEAYQYVSGGGWRMRWDRLTSGSGRNECEMDFSLKV